MSTHLRVELGPLVAARTYGAIIDHFERRFDDCGEEYRAKVLTIIRDIVLEIASRYDWKWLHGDDTVVTQQGLAEYSLNGNVAWIEAGVMTISGQGVVRRRPLGFVRRCQGDSEGQGQPRYFAMTGRQSVVFWPTPDSAYTLLYDYRRQFADEFLESDTPPMPVSDTFVLNQGVEEQLRRDENRFDPASRLAASRFESGIDQLIFNEECGENRQMIPEDLPPNADVDHLSEYYTS